MIKLFYIDNDYYVKNSFFFSRKLAKSFCKLNNSSWVEWFCYDEDKKEFFLDNSRLYLLSYKIGQNK